MLDVLADTYRIATRMETLDPPQTPPRPPAGAEKSGRVRPHRPSPRATWLGQAWKWIGDRLAAWRERERARENALRMSEHQLRDIGVSRHELLRAIAKKR